MRWQWTLAGALLCSVCVLGGQLVFSKLLETQSERWMSDRALAITRVLAQTLSSTLERGELLAAQRQLELLAALPEARFGVFLLEDGTPLVAWNPQLAPKGPWPDSTQELLLLPAVVVARLPVRARGGAQGTLLVGLERAGSEHEGRAAWWRASLASWVLWVLGVGMAFGLGMWLLRPLERLTRTVQRLAGGEGFSREALEPSAPDEPGRLSAALVRLVGGVHGQVDVLDALVGEARGYQERVHVQHQLLDAQARELLEVRAQLAVAERRCSVGVLSAGLAHEVNNPLASISANLQFSLEELRGLALRDAFAAERLRREDDWAELTRALTEARESCLHVQHLMHGLRSFSCEDDGRHVPLNPVSALKTALRMASSELHRRARLVQELQEDVCVDGNEVRLAQVFLNLLLNAAHAISPGAVERNEIRVTLRRGSDGWARVSITDTGCGMSPEVHARLFTPFFTTRPAGVGMGLGLSVCQGLVQGMGGRIEVRSEPGRGSTFSVWLPEARAERDVAASPPSSSRPLVDEGPSA
ncbi:hypothetical protein BON30_44405 [Cystobacter ferrugineus]|uniref:histidine kinase n=1 Tax=Cystobacter ferrugineus TaxID=83449 RepID=A0A1L9AWG8_9BACT|nr:hypothetical protein BON30_44405 [Cystobacter ferrugineus]